MHHCKNSENWLLAKYNMMFLYHVYYLESDTLDAKKDCVKEKSLGIQAELQHGMLIKYLTESMSKG